MSRTSTQLATSTMDVRASIVDARKSGLPLILDACCGIGGAGMGYSLAGWAVIGVDTVAQPDYPFPFLQGDALDFAARYGHLFDAIHWSPPCLANTALTKGNRRRPGWMDGHIDIIPEVRAVSGRVGRPYVIENVQGSSLRRDLTLCGEMFGLAVIRHRYFELGGWVMDPPAHRPHRGRVAGWRHGVRHDGPYVAVYGDGGGKGTVDQWRGAMEIYWCTNRAGIAQAIPPRYTRLIGGRLIRWVGGASHE